MTDTSSTAAALMRQVVAHDRTIVTAESCTAGGLARILAATPGASRGLFGGFVVYTKAAKCEVLGVPGALLAERTAVCQDVALAMAAGALARTSADLAIAVTGVTGPQPDDDGNPVGLVHVAVAARDSRAVHERLNLAGDTPGSVVEETIGRALALALQFDLQSQFTATRGR